MDVLPSIVETDALHLDSLGLIHSPMFRLDSHPELDTPAPGTPPLSVLGLEAMPTPQCVDSPTSSVDSEVPGIDFRQISSPGSAWSCSTDVSDRAEFLPGSLWVVGGGGSCLKDQKDDEAHLPQAGGTGGGASC